MRADAAVKEYVAYLSALFYWHLAAFFDRNFNALFGGNLPATDLRNLEEGELKKTRQKICGIRLTLVQISLGMELQRSLGTCWQLS